MEINNRINKLRKYLKEFSLDGFLVTNQTNIKYLTNFTGDDGIVLVTFERVYLISDQRFKIELNNLRDIQPIISNEYLKATCDIISKDHLIAVGFEDSIEFSMYDYLDENATSDIVSISNLIESLRSIKSNNEIQKIKKANLIAKKAFDFFIDKIDYQTERSLAIDLDYFLKKNGADKPSFDTIIASGSNTVLPHSTISNRKINHNDLVMLDFGYFVNDYTFDITRTISLGKQNKEIKKVYNVVLDALNETTKLVRSGLPANLLYERAKKILKSNNLDQYFTHGIGHGIGLSIHELPNLNSFDELISGQIITIEPGVYIPGLGGIRIENDILVTENGYENLTPISTEFIEL